MTVAKTIAAVAVWASALISCNFFPVFPNCRPRFKVINLRFQSCISDMSDAVKSI